MTLRTRRDQLDRALSMGNGILRLEPAWVAREFLPAGRRLGLNDDQYDLGERGEICERWLGSTTKADNRIGPSDEGLSYLSLDGEHMTLLDAIESAPKDMMGADYAATHDGLGRLAKLFDYNTRLPLHLHHPQEYASLVGRRSKDEAYYFPPGVDEGSHPETFLGVHPSIVEGGNQDLLLPYLEDWDSDLILRHSSAYLQVPEEGFHVQSGVLHAPGSALTVELQEDSDVLSMLQAVVDGHPISKDLLWKDVRPEDKKTKGERFILELIDWEQNGDPYIYENHHLSPQLIEGSVTDGGEEYWIFYDSLKFSGKRLAVKPGFDYRTTDAGAYSLLVLSGGGTYGNVEVQAGDPARDELYVTWDAAQRGVDVRNTSREELTVIKFFGPDVNPDVPMIERR